MRRTNPAQPRTHIRMSAVVTVQDHAKICALSALRGVDRGALAGGLIRAGLRNVVVRDSSEPEGPPDPAQ